MTREQKAETSFHAALLSKCAKALSFFGIPQKYTCQFKNSQALTFKITCWCATEHPTNQQYSTTTPQVP